MQRNGRRTLARRPEYRIRSIPDDASSRELPQHVLRDAAVLEVLQLVERIDPAHQRHALERSIGTDDLGNHALVRLEIAVQAADRHLLAALETQRLPRRAFL